MKKTDILQIQQFRDRDSEEDFYANTLEDHLVTRHKDIALPHSHDFYLAILFTHGTGTHEVDFTAYTVAPGALFFLNPGQTHHWELSADTKGFVFFHSQEFYNLHYTRNNLGSFPFFYSMHNNPCLYIKDDAFPSITNYFRQILAENKLHHILKKQRLISLIDLLYIDATRIYTEASPSAPQNRNSYYVKFRKLEQLIENRYKEEKSPAAYASLLSISPKHLNRIAQAVAGKTAGDVILERVLLEAKKELVLQRRSFKEIAFLLGYDDYAYFSRLFKKKTGETPSGFLAKYRSP